MSIEAMNRVWYHSDATGSSRLVMLALADHANEASVCWPSIARICEKTRVSRRQVSRILQDLEEQCELYVRAGGSGPGDTNKYILLPGLNKRQILEALQSKWIGLTALEADAELRAMIDRCLSNKSDNMSPFERSQNSQATEKSVRLSPLGEDKSDNMSPLDANRGDISAAKGDISAAKGDIDDTQTVKPSVLKPSELKPSEPKPARDVKDSRGLSTAGDRDPPNDGRAGSRSRHSLRQSFQNLGIQDPKTLQACVDVADRAGFAPGDVEIWFQQALERLREIQEVREPLKVAIHRFRNDSPRPPGEEERVGVRVEREFQSAAAGAGSPGGEEPEGADRVPSTDSPPAAAISTRWNRAKAELRLSMTQATFERHFAGAEAAGYDEDGILTIVAPSDLSKEWIEARFIGPCLKAAYAAGFEDINWIEVTVKEEAA